MWEETESAASAFYAGRIPWECEPWRIWKYGGMRYAGDCAIHRGRVGEYARL